MKKKVTNFNSENNFNSEKIYLIFPGARINKESADKLKTLDTDGAPRGIRTLDYGYNILKLLYNFFCRTTSAPPNRFYA